MKSILFLAVFQFFCLNVFAAQEVRKSNDVLNIPLGPQLLSTGGVALGLSPEVERVLLNPALGVQGQNEISMTHSKYFVDTDLSSLAGLIVLDSSKSAIFFSLARFGADGIPLTFEDSLGRPVDKGGKLIEGNPETFSIKDIWVSSGYALSVLDLDLGVTFNFLYRDLGDQWALGLRSDASAVKRFNNLRLGLLWKAWSTSPLYSESGSLEYEPSDLYAGLGYHMQVPYFYGAIDFAWQSAPWVHKGNRSRQEVSGERVWSDPANWLGDSKFAVEYESKWGVGLNMGWAFVREWKYPAWGFDFKVKKVSFAYGWEGHPELGDIHSFGLKYSFGSAVKKSNSNDPKTTLLNKGPVLSEDKMPEVEKGPVDMKEDFLGEEVLAEESVIGVDITADTSVDLVPMQEVVPVVEIDTNEVSAPEEELLPAEEVNAIEALVPKELSSPVPNKQIGEGLIEEEALPEEVID
jgi:hypothetical protein